MNPFKLASLLLPLLASLASLVTPSAAGPCSKINGARPAIQSAYSIPAERNAANTWKDTFAVFGYDGFNIVVNGGNKIHMDSKAAGQSHKYVVILEYNSGSTEWLWLDSGSGCDGLPAGQSVQVPLSVRVARVA